MNEALRDLGALPLTLALALLAAGCADAPPELALSSPDRTTFETTVYPILLRDCSFHACHGGNKRFFQVYGPGRERLNPMTPPLDPPLPEEIEQTYARARSMIDADHPERSLLLIKPLSTAAGGAGHEGVDSLGRNVYTDKLDPSYAVLSAWVMSAPPAASTTPPPTTPMP